MTSQTNHRVRIVVCFVRIDYVVCRVVFLFPSLWRKVDGFSGVPGARESHVTEAIKGQSRFRS